MDGNKTSLPNYLSGQGSKEKEEGIGDNGILQFLLEEKQHMGENPYLNLLIEGIRKGSLDPDLARESYEKYLEKEGIRRPPDSDAKTRLPYGGVTQHSALIDTRYADSAGARSPQPRREAQPQAFFGRKAGFDEDTFGRMESEVEPSGDSYRSDQDTAAADNEAHSHLFDDFDIPEYANNPPGDSDSEQRGNQDRHRFDPPSFAHPSRHTPTPESESLLLDYDATRTGGIGVYVPPRPDGGGLEPTDAHDYYQRTRLPGDFSKQGPVSSPPIVPPYRSNPDARYADDLPSLAEEPTDFDDSPYLAAPDSDLGNVVGEDPRRAPQRFSSSAPPRHFDDFASDSSDRSSDDETSLPLFEPGAHFEDRFESQNLQEVKGVSGFSQKGPSKTFQQLDDSTECEATSLVDATDASDSFDDDSPFEAERTQLTDSNAQSAPLQPLSTALEVPLDASFRTQADPVHFPEPTSADLVEQPFAPAYPQKAHDDLSARQKPTPDISDEVTAERPRSEQGDPVLFAEQLNIDSFVIDQFFGEGAGPFAEEPTERETSESADIHAPQSGEGQPMRGSSTPPPFQQANDVRHTKLLHRVERPIPDGPSEPSTPSANPASASLTPPPVNRTMAPRIAPPPPSRVPSPPPTHRPLPAGPGLRTPPPPPSERPERQHGEARPVFVADKRSRPIPPPPPPSSSPTGGGAPPLAAPVPLVSAVHPPAPGGAAGHSATAPPPPTPTSSDEAPFKSEECIPQFIVPFTELSQRGINIDHRMAYALSQIDGYCCVRDICDIVGIPVEEMVDALNELAKKNIVRKK